MNFMESKDGFSISSIIGVVVALIILIAVAVPITQKTVTAANFTAGSVEAVISSNLVVLLMVGAILLVVSLYNVAA